MPRRRFRLRLAIALVAIAIAGQALGAPPQWTYYEDGTSRVHRIWQGVMARCAAAWAPPGGTTEAYYYTIETNEQGVVQVKHTEQRPYIEDWDGRDILKAEHLQELDALLMAVTTNYVDHFFAGTNSTDNYNKLWFEAEAYVPVDGYLTTNGNFDVCELDDDWRNVYRGYDDQTGAYEDPVGRYRIKMPAGMGDLPEGNTTSTGSYYLVISPTNYPFLTPAAVGFRTGVGVTDKLQYDPWGCITGGQFRFTKDWRDVEVREGTGTVANVSRWVLWEAAAARAPYTWSGLSDNSSIGTGDGLLIPYWIDPYRDNWLSAYSSTRTTNLWAEQAGYLRGKMDRGPYYISYPLHDVSASDWGGEYFTVVGRRAISNRYYWCQSIGYFNPVEADNTASRQQIRLVTRGTNTVPEEWEVFYYADLTNKYAPATLLTSSETNAFWVQWDEAYGEFYVDYLNEGDLLIAPATNKWYWRQWRGDAVPRRWLPPNVNPVYRLVSGEQSSLDIPVLHGYKFGSIDPVLGQVLLECSEQAAVDAAAEHEWRSVEQSSGWLHTPPSTQAVLRLEYAPAPTLHNEAEVEPMTRLTEIMLEEREKYIDYLIHCCSPTAPGWDWQQTQVAKADDYIAECPTNRATGGEFETDDKTEEELWAESQAKMGDLAAWVSGTVDDLLEDGGFEWWANNIIDYLDDDGFWDDAGAQSRPAAWMDMYKNATLSAGYYTTWWTTPTPSWIAKRREPWPEYGANHFLETSTTHGYEYDWRYSAAAGWLSGSKNSFHFTRSKCVSASTPEELRIPNGQYADLEAICVKSNHYARERYRQSDLDFFDAAADWVRLPFSLHEEVPLLPEIPACLVSACAAPTNLSLAVSEYDPPELTAAGGEGPLEYWAQDTNATPVVQSWVPQIGGDWSPIFEPTEYAVEVRSNAAWNVTINVESNGIYYTTNGIPRPWIATGYYLTEDMQPVYLWTVTNDYDLLYTYAEEAHILDPPGMPEWDAYTNYLFYTPFESDAITYQTCTNLPHGSTTVKGQDGVINCNHDVEKTVKLLASVGYIAETNIVYFERSITDMGYYTNWLAVNMGSYPEPPVAWLTDPVETNITFLVDDWPGEWVTWTRVASARRAGSGFNPWMGGHNSTGTAYQAEVAAEWDYLPPLVYWQFYRLRND